VAPGGTYNRSNDPLYPATVSDFGLDRFEITVGRFRAFVAAYPGSKPAPGAGAHPLIADSGWDPAWDGNLPPGQLELETAMKCPTIDPWQRTWTDMPGANEYLPMNCLTWYEAFAFCAWDGGRLPTEAEWNYAAAGGDQQREYPWSNPSNSITIDSSSAVYDCAADFFVGCSPGDIAQVGSRPKGAGRWGQADLGGSMWEWTLDLYVDPYLNQCSDCANIQMGFNRVVRGGSWDSDAVSLLSSERSSIAQQYDGVSYGARCARAP
jgi:formylglycine-generating enzyme required for sulfatase activity